MNPVINLSDLINLQIRELNSRGVAFIWVITGASSSGKSTITKKIFSLLDISTIVPLGIVSKSIRLVKEINHENFEDNRSTIANSYFRDIIDYFCKYYFEKGVNVIIEGIQIDTKYFQENTNLLGGNILLVDNKELIKRGNRPATHFKRITSKKVIDVNYSSNDKFYPINNNQDLDNTVYEVLLNIHTKLNNILSVEKAL